MPGRRRRRIRRWRLISTRGPEAAERAKKRTGGRFTTAPFASTPRSLRTSGCISSARKKRWAARCRKRRWWALSARSSFKPALSACRSGFTTTRKLTLPALSITRCRAWITATTRSIGACPACSSPAAFPSCASRPPVSAGARMAFGRMKAVSAGRPFGCKPTPTTAFIFGASRWDGYQETLPKPQGTNAPVHLNGMDMRFTQGHWLLRGEYIAGELSGEQMHGAYLDAYYRLPPLPGVDTRFPHRRAAPRQRLPCLPSADRRRPLCRHPELDSHRKLASQQYERGLRHHLDSLFQQWSTAFPGLLQNPIGPVIGRIGSVGFAVPSKKPVHPWRAARRCIRRACQCRRPRLRRSGGWLRRGARRYKRERPHRGAC